MKLLIVEDETLLVDAMLTYFTMERYECDVAQNLTQAKICIDKNSYDCIILDLMLPDGDGMALLRDLRTSGNGVGLIVVTAKGTLEDKIKGLELGSDDYLTKPFHLSELNARIKSLVRRRQFDGQNVIELHELYVDLSGNTVRGNGNLITLTPKEYRLLVYFLSNKERVVTKQSVAQHLWADDFNDGSYDFIYTHVKNLRKKLVDAGCKDYIKTIYGFGYKFSAE